MIRSAAIGGARRRGASRRGVAHCFAMAIAVFLAVGLASSARVPPANAQQSGSQWRIPEGNTGMELLPAPADPAIARNGADGATRPGATRPSDFVLDKPYLAIQVMTYHYGARQQPGAIALLDDDGVTYGPWPAAGAVGQGGVRNAYWWAQPNVALKPGHYLVIDSDPSTWSVEDATQGAGIFIVWGHPN